MILHYEDRGGESGVSGDNPRLLTLDQMSNTESVLELVLKQEPHTAVLPLLDTHRHPELALYVLVVNTEKRSYKVF